MFGSTQENILTPKSPSILTSGLTTILVIILVILVIINGLQYVWGIDVVAFVKSEINQMKKQPKGSIEIDIDMNNSNKLNKPEGVYPVPEITYKEQVFNIPENKYSYPNAKALCAAYGARLANYDEVEDAYNKGSEWCNYGWTDGQMALFPTQTASYNKLQAIPGHQHDCGRPGVNGGYIANPNVNFGVNCYGHKPKINKEEAEYMEEATPFPESAQDIAFQKRVDYWKTQVDNILVSPFNYDTWDKL